MFYSNAQAKEEFKAEVRRLNLKNKTKKVTHIQWNKNAPSATASYLQLKRSTFSYYSRTHLFFKKTVYNELCIFFFSDF